MKLLNLGASAIVLGLIFSSCTSVKEHDSNLIAPKMDSLMNNLPDFSGVILVATDGKVRYHKAFGFKDYEKRSPLDTANIFELASVSKQFTAMVIMILKEEGKLDYDDSLSSYIPGLPYKGITIRHLLTHTSGLPDYQDVMDQHWDKTKVASNDDNISYLIKYHPGILSPPGDKYEYSNTGYMLLASVAEKASGTDFIEFCRQRIFTPLRMQSTDIRTRDEKKNIANFAPGYIYVEDKHRYVAADSFPEFNYTIWLGDRKGPGRISSTSSDLLKWDRALYTENLVKQTTLNEAFSPMKLTSGSLSNYGFGWEIVPPADNGRIVLHTGDNPGYKTAIIRYVDSNKTIIVLSNNASESINSIVSFIQRQLAQ
ncbi:MAG TPA: serine hydrolase domain-containing protein [Chryseolinea sp.]|nr:serine hydrolase domain-containing protein [Chryseolinea sp.]